MCVHGIPDLPVRPPLAAPSPACLPPQPHCASWLGDPSPTPYLKDPYPWPGHAWPRVTSLEGLLRPLCLLPSARPRSLPLPWSRLAAASFVRKGVTPCCPHHMRTDPLSKPLFPPETGVSTGHKGGHEVKAVSTRSSAVIAIASAPSLKLPAPQGGKEDAGEGDSCPACPRPHLLPTPVQSPSARPAEATQGRRPAKARIEQACSLPSQLIQC